MTMERLQRVLSSRGIASRRRAEEMIVEGRIRVDGIVVTELGTKVDADSQKIEVDGNLIPNQRRRYILLHKPRGYITTMDDERGRDTVMDLVRVEGRVVPVGRLDRLTEGLLLLTNDGEVAHRVMHPRFEIDKEYEALLDGFPPPEALERLRRGITVDGQQTKPTMVRPMRNTEDGLVVRVIIHEGRNRIVRRMFEEIGYPVDRLIRTRIGPLQLGSIPRGQFRDLTDGELRQLREAVGLTDEDVVNDEGLFRSRGAPDRNPRTPRRPGETQPAQRGGAPGRSGQGRPSGPPRRPGGPSGPERRAQSGNPNQRGPARFPSNPGQNADRNDRTEGPPLRRDNNRRPERSDPRGRPEHPAPQREYDRGAPRPHAPQAGPEDRRKFVDRDDKGRPERGGPPRRGPARNDRQSGPGRPPGGPIRRPGPRRDDVSRDARQGQGNRRPDSPRDSGSGPGTGPGKDIGSGSSE